MVVFIGEFGRRASSCLGWHFPQKSICYRKSLLFPLWTLIIEKSVAQPLNASSPGASTEGWLPAGDFGVEISGVSQLSSLLLVAGRLGFMEAQWAGWVLKTQLSNSSFYSWENRGSVEFNNVSKITSFCLNHTLSAQSLSSPVPLPQACSLCPQPTLHTHKQTRTPLSFDYVSFIAWVESASQRIHSMSAQQRFLR